MPFHGSEDTISNLFIVFSVPGHGTYTSFFGAVLEIRDVKNDFVLNVEVVNDCAERGIHLINDFKNSTFDENQQEYLFQVVENHRKRIDSLKKSDLSGI